MPTSSLASLFADRLRSQPEAPFLTVVGADGTGREVSNGQIHAAAAWHARALADRRVAPGELVVIAHPTVENQLAAFVGALYHGALPALVQPTVDVERLVVATGAAAAVRAGSGPLREEGGVVISGPSAFEVPDDIDPSDRAGEDAAYVQLTSGSTGSPKGVILSHGAVLANLLSQREALEAGRGATSVNWIPLYHDMGLSMTVLYPVRFGVRSVWIETEAWLRSPALLPRAIDTYRGSSTWMPNFAFDLCVRGTPRDEVQGLDLSCWERVGNGAEPITPEPVERFIEHFAPAGLDPRALRFGYGLAEYVVGVSCTAPNERPGFDPVSAEGLRAGVAEPVDDDDDTPVRLVARCGPPPPSTEVRVVGEEGQALPDRQVGELCVRGGSLFSGYWRDPAATEAALRDGWLHTGDLGYVADGQVHVCGRLKDLIVVGGHNVYPEAVDRAATAAARALLPDAVRFALALGVPSATLATETLVVVCELRREVAPEDAGRLREGLRAAAAEAAGVVPTAVQFVPARWTPKTTSGKVRRSEASRRFVASFGSPGSGDRLGEGGAAPSPSSPTREDLRSWVLERLDLGPVADADDLFVAGAGSLQFVEVVLAVQDRVGRTLPLDALLRHPTLGHLLDTALGGDAAAPEPDPERPDANEAPLALTSPRALRGRPLLAASAGRAWLRTRSGGEGRLGQTVREAAARVCPARDAGRIVQRALVRRDVRRWLGTGRLPSVARSLRLEGDAGLAALRETDAGVILLGCHTTGYGLVPAWAAQAGRPVSAIRRPQEVAVPSADPHVRQRLAGEVARAQACLEEGGVVFISGDGHFVQDGPEVPFHGKAWPVGAGFAALAEWTGAQVVPVFTRFRGGRIEAVLDPPLRIEAGIDAAVRRYAERLEGWWADHLEEVYPFYLSRYLALPDRLEVAEVGRRVEEEPVEEGRAG